MTLRVAALLGFLLGGCLGPDQIAWESEGVSESFVCNDHITYTGGPYLAGGNERIPASPYWCRISTDQLERAGTLPPRVNIIRATPTSRNQELGTAPEFYEADPSTWYFHAAIWWPTFPAEGVLLLDSGVTNCRWLQCESVHPLKPRP